jgi:hypothetical protein
MPICRIIDSKRQLLLSRVQKTLSCEDILSHLRAKALGRLFELSEIFDARDVTLDLSHGDIPTIVEAVRIQLGSSTPGKIAIVTNDTVIYNLACQYTAMTKASNPKVEVFSHEDEAMSWLLGPGSVFN